MRTRGVKGLLLAAWAAGCIACSGAGAQAYPSKPIQLVVPFSAGNAITDTVARLISPRLGEQLGQPIVISNRAGANGLIGTEFVARSAADGYTLLLTTPSTHITAVFVTRDLPYDPVKDFTPITAAVEPVTGIAVLPSFPASSMRELVEMARRNPGKLSFSSTGIGSVFHLTGEMLKQAAGIDLLHVPYKANQQAVTDLLAGRINVLLNPVLLIAPQAKAGKMKLLAVMEARRFNGLPDVPTVGETVPGFEKPPSWLGIFAPSNLPAPITARLNSESVRTLALPEVRSRLEEGGTSVIANSSAEFAEQIRRGLEIYGRAVRAAGVKPE